jgi:hypothetical protein
MNLERPPAMQAAVKRRAPVIWKENNISNSNRFYEVKRLHRRVDALTASPIVKNQMSRGLCKRRPTSSACKSTMASGKLHRHVKAAAAARNLAKTVTH